MKNFEYAVLTEKQQQQAIHDNMQTIYADEHSYLPCCVDHYLRHIFVNSCKKVRYDIKLQVYMVCMRITDLFTIKIKKIFDVFVRA